MEPRLVKFLDVWVNPSIQKIIGSGDGHYKKDARIAYV